MKKLRKKKLIYLCIIFIIIIISLILWTKIVLWIDLLVTLYLIVMMELYIRQCRSKYEEICKIASIIVFTLNVFNNINVFNIKLPVISGTWTVIVYSLIMIIPCLTDIHFVNYICYNKNSGISEIFNIGYICISYMFDSLINKVYKNFLNNRINYLSNEKSYYVKTFNNSRHIFKNNQEDLQNQISRIARRIQHMI